MLGLTGRLLIIGGRDSVKGRMNRGKDRHHLNIRPISQMRLLQDYYNYASRLNQSLPSGDAMLELKCSMPKSPVFYTATQCFIPP
jgi:hypothetical protein